MKIWKGLRRYSLFQQILLVGLVPMLLMFVALFSYSLAARLSDAAESQREIGQRLAENIASLSELAMISGDQQQLHDVLHSALAEDIVSITVTQVDGETQWRVANPQLDAGTSQTVFANILPRSLSIKDSITGETMSKGDSRVLGTVVVEQSTLALQQLQQQIINISTFIAVLVMIISIALAWYISRRLANPLAEINSATRAIANGKSGVVLPRVHAGELGELQKHINDMSASLDNQKLALKNHVKQLEAAKLEAEQANRAKSMFLATMTHELRTPMNGALGMLQLLAETELNEEQSRYVGIARDASEHLLALVNDILDFSRIEKGDLQLERCYFSITTVMEKVLRSLEHEATAKGITLRMTLQPELQELEILGDETRYRQILLNLGSNAIKFSERGEVVLLLQGHQHDSQELSLEITVSDTGVGISPEQQAIIFNSFQQADGSTQRRYGGSGLGLAIVKHLCQAMDLEIQLSSEAGRGSVFTLRGRCQYRYYQSSNSLPAAPAAKFCGLRALVVEDNPVNQLLVSNVLTKWGLTVTTANNGAEALLQLQQQRPNVVDVVLMDLQMPIMDGFEASQAIRQNPDHKSLIIIALTANTLQEDRQRCLQCGMDDYLSKPVSLPLLREKLTYWLGREAGTISTERVDKPGQ